MKRLLALAAFVLFALGSAGAEAATGCYYAGRCLSYAPLGVPCVPCTIAAPTATPRPTPRPPLPTPTAAPPAPTPTAAPAVAAPSIQFRDGSYYIDVPFGAISKVYVNGVPVTSCNTLCNLLRLTP